MAEKTLEISAELQTFVNKSYDLYAKKYHNLTKHGFKIKQELVAKSAIWVAKKRYAQYIVNEEGMSANELNVKGLDSVRSNFPPLFAKFMEKLLVNILYNDYSKNQIDEYIMKFKRKLKDADLMFIAKPGGVKGVDKYTRSSEKGKFSITEKGAPAHVKAAIYYNDMIRINGLDKKFRLIKSHDKIRTVYLKQNPYGIETLAFKGYEDPDLVINYIKQYIDIDRIFKANLENKLIDFYKALHWGIIPTEHSMRVGKFFG